MCRSQWFMDAGKFLGSHLRCTHADSAQKFQLAWKLFLVKQRYSRILSLSQRLVCCMHCSYYPSRQSMHGTFCSLEKHNRSRNWARSLQKRTTFGLVAQTGISCLTCDCALWTCQRPVDGICAGRLFPLLPSCWCVPGTQAALVTISQPNFHSLAPVNGTNLESPDCLVLLRRRHVSKPSGAFVPLQSFANPGCMSMPNRSRPQYAGR